MSTVVFNSTRGDFMRKHRAFKDMLLGHMAMDIEVGIKMTAGTPVLSGDLKSETRHFRSGNGGFRVESDKEYAAYQERGMRRDGTYRVQNYHTPGTSAGWFQRAIDAVWSRQASYVNEVKRALGL